MTDWATSAEQRRLVSELGWLPDDQLQVAGQAFRDWVHLAETLQLWRDGVVRLAWDADRGLVATRLSTNGRKTPHDRP